MKAVVMNGAGGREVLEYIERPDPVPGPGEALVEIAFAGVNFMDIGVAADDDLRRAALAQHIEGWPRRPLRHVPVCIGLELIAARALELQLEFEFMGQGVLLRLPLPDTLFNLDNGLELRLERLPLLACRCAGVVLQIVNQFLERLLDDGSGDGLILIRLVGGNLMRGFNRLGKLAMCLGDGRLNCLNGIGLGLKEGGDKVGIENQRMMPSG